MMLGLASEGASYIACMLMHGNPFILPYFLQYLICLTLGPVFFAAAIYLCLGHVVMIYREEISRIRPRTYTFLFIGFDSIALILQAVGGGIAASVPITNDRMVCISYSETNPAAHTACRLILVLTFSSLVFPSRLQACLLSLSAVLSSSGVSGRILACAVKKAWILQKA